MAILTGGGYADAYVTDEELIGFYLRDSILDLLHDADQSAKANVDAGRGGPFGASLTVYHHSLQERWRNIGTVATNTVLQTGVSSNHAVSNLLSPQNIAELKDTLRKVGPGALIIHSSNSESSPACHAKLEILARTLKQEGLIQEPTQFLAAYGAPYQQTHDFTGFNDEQYLLDMQKPDGERTIETVTASIDDIPDHISEIFECAAHPVAMVDNHIVTAHAYDNRTSNMMETPEIAAIRMACALQNEQGKETPWDLRRATLYTSTRDIGPLAYAEGLWANIRKIVSVDHDRAAEFQTQEAPGILNREFFRVVAQRPYNGHGSAITIRRLDGFDNLAQHAWRARLEAAKTAGNAGNMLYNGAEPG